MTHAMNRHDAATAADGAATTGPAEGLVDNPWTAEAAIGYEAADPAVFAIEWPELPDGDSASRRLR
jgi:hypothetical protein